MFNYCFSVWPDEQSPRMRSCPPVFELFRHLMTRTEMPFTERAFGDFREELAKVGLTLREIERTPFVEPETVV